jgi:hypothetical protein
MKIDKANKKNPFLAPQINKEQELKHSIRLTGFQIGGCFLCVVTLLILAISRWGQHAPLYVEGLRWEPLQRFCRVSFTVKNPRNQSIEALALIQFSASLASSEFAYYFPTGSIKVPLRLASNETRMVTKDVVYSEITSGCQHVEIFALGLTNQN